MASTANRTRPPRTSVKYTRSLATSRLGVYRKSSCSSGCSVIAQGIDAAGVRAADELGDAVGVGGRAFPAAHPVLEDRCQAAAERHGTKVVELGQREAVGGVELLGERRQLHGLGQDPDGTRPGVVEGQPHVEV